ncbi:hypothetical protein H0H93_011477 [Arthromyces matolae]|nr:hypothetical protein H0H93_011477 [Arthromyces matolae]
MNFNNVRDSHPVVTSDRNLPEDTDTGLTSRSSDLLEASYSNTPTIPRGSFDEAPLEARISGEDKPSEGGGAWRKLLKKLVPKKNEGASVEAAGKPIQQLLRGKDTRPSLQTAGNPIQQLLTNELAADEYKVVDPSLPIRMLRLDLLFALTEENDFKELEVANLEKQMETDRSEFLKYLNKNSVANTCLSRLMYQQKVLDSKDKYHVVRAAPPQVLGNAKTYRLYLEGEIQKIEGPQTNMIALSLLDRITLLGLKFNLLKEDGFPEDQTRDFAKRLNVDLTIFHVKSSEGDTKDIARVCDARGKYYQALLPMYTSSHRLIQE